jgi:hypothetical protein
MKSTNEISPKRRLKIIKMVSSMHRDGGGICVGSNARGKCLVAYNFHGKYRHFPNAAPFWWACIEGMKLAGILREMEGRPTLGPKAIKVQ